MREIIHKNTEKITILNINLNLITKNCKIFYLKNENELPFPSPWWGFLWPGGLSIGKYLLNNPLLVQNKVILDLGCGCGLISILASKLQAKKVIANDIDIYAQAALQLNLESNRNINSNIIEFCNDNLLVNEAEYFHQFDIIFCGDMLYDLEFSNQLLKKLSGHKMVIFGDPGRWCCPKNILNECLLAEYPLDGEDGFHTGRVFRHL